MDPAARFNDEVARIARENDADVAFQLVDREDDAVSDTDKCCIHNQALTRWATDKLVVESKETGQKVEKGLCKYHADALRQGNWAKAAVDTDARRFEKLKEAAREKERLTVSVVRKVGEPDRDSLHSKHSDPAVGSLATVGLCW
jgi:hypothetical protein